MAETRAKVALIEDPCPLENKAKIIWCVLECHITMHKFIGVHFQGHPVIVKETMMFMVSERVDPTELKNMATKMKTVEDENKLMKTTLAKLEENCNALKRSLENLHQDVKPIKAKVSKL
jgi:septal ring factor EnvC (AmiA/AmiB activator)